MKNFKILIILTLIMSIFAYADEYTFGDGLQVADSPLYVGGYISSIVDINKNSKTASIDDIAFLAYGEYDRFDFLSEFETADLYKKEFDNHRDENSSNKIHIERLYGDYFFGNYERVRVGKFNSDIGFWNQMPINVLRDTTSSPSLVNDFFPKLTTGIHYESRQSLGMVNRVSVTLQHNNDLDIGFNNFNVNQHYAVAFDTGDEEISWRFGGGYFQYDSYRDVMYALGAMKIESKEWDFLLESILRHDDVNGALSYDVYAQGVWHVEEAHDLILRTEVEKTPLTYTHDGSLIIGYTYRPLSNIALKSEYVGHQDSYLNRYLFSFSVLF